MKKTVTWIVCEWCGNSVPKERDTAKYCSSNCRVAASRHNRREASIGLDGFTVEELATYIKLRQRDPWAAALVRRVRRQHGLQPARLAFYASCSAAGLIDILASVAPDVADSMIESDFVLPDSAAHNG